MYKLICMDFEGRSVAVKRGSFEECEQYMINIGSEWFFYPFRFICTEKNTVISPEIRLINLNKNKAYSEALFRKRKLKTVSKMFQKAIEFCQNKEFSVNPLEFEEILIAQNIEKINWKKAPIL